MMKSFYIVLGAFLLLGGAQLLAISGEKQPSPLFRTVQ